jgi:cell division protein FtsX
MAIALVTSIAINVLLMIAFAMGQKVLSENKKRLEESLKKNMQLSKFINQMQKNREEANEKINSNHDSIDNALSELSN